MIQQLREAFPDEPSHRLFLILDNDSIFSGEVSQSAKRLGITPTRTSFRGPWQNGTAERFVGTARRELLDHVVVLSEDHLRRLLREYVDYYNAERVHTSSGDAPAGRALEDRPFIRRRGGGSAARWWPPPSLRLARRGLISLAQSARQTQGASG